MMRRWLAAASWVGTAMTIVAPQAAAEDREPLYPHAVVAADHPLASAAGIEILQRGGNVVDAAVATGFALSVLRPASSGLGGGGFMVVWNAETQRAFALDYREQAPRAATESMYVDPERPGEPVDGLSLHGPLAVAVPGHVAGLFEAHRRWGKLSWKTVLEPAIRLARDGVELDAHERDGLNELRQDLIAERQAEAAGKRRHPSQATAHYAPLERLYLPPGGTEPGARRTSPQRAALERIAERGADGFYTGPVAESLLRAAGTPHGLLTADDLAGYRPQERAPLQRRFREFDVVTMPPPSSGGVALLQVFGMLDAWSERPAERRAQAPDWPDLKEPERIHLMLEMAKHAFADRAEFLGDPDFADVPVEKLLSRNYLASLASRIDLAQTFPPEHYGRHQPPHDGGTTHFCVLDAEGNAVACTETINTSFGSWVADAEFGVILNNEMDDFAAVPGKPNAFKLIQSRANAVAAGKRPLSSMTPTIIVRDGRAVFAAGASGGPRIITSTLQVLLEMIERGTPPQQAVDRPRWHHQGRPDEVLLEPGLEAMFRRPLESRGHKVRIERELSAVQAVRRVPGGVQGGSDPRKHGRSAGF